MFYLKINDEIKKLIELAQIQIGCKYFCSSQLIAIDELELLIKFLENKKILMISDSEFKRIKSNSEAVYCHTVHMCSENNLINSKIEEEEEEQQILEDLKKDKINKKPIRNFRTEVDYEFAVRKAEEKNFNLQDDTKKTENTFGYGMSMIGGLLLLSLGSYYLGKHLLEFDDYHTYILTLIVTIIVFLAESILLVIRLNKQTLEESKTNPIRLKENSFAYKFNKKYRSLYNKDYNFKNKFEKAKTD